MNSARTLSELKELRQVKEVADKLLNELDAEKRKLEEAKAKQEAILASIGDGVVVTDEEERVVFINTSAERILGLKKKQVMGKLWTDAQVVEDEQGEQVPRNKRLMHRVLKSRAVKSSSRKETHYYARGDGTRFPVYVTASPILLGKKVIGAVEVFRDITEEKAIDKAKSEFVSIASHELYTPLSSLRWHTEMLLDGSVGQMSEDQTKIVKTVENSALRMIDLVGALLNVSRIELGTFAVNPEPTDLSAVAKDAVADLFVQAKEQGVAVETECDENLPLVNVDPKLMRIVFDNLLSNAVKYTPSRGRVRMTLKKGEGEYAKSAVLSVKDTGYGIPINEQQKIFTKLFRASNAVKNVVNGTGLGLYTVKAIVERFGG
ncbi:MAG: PAS domain-containing protein, partial [Candidatus Jacksonbacteria bacterium]|nr:PAS domain-containing protein [Candidatus Jacksonbacteria bacterium]